MNPPRGLPPRARAGHPAAAGAVWLLLGASCVAGAGTAALVPADPELAALMRDRMNPAFTRTSHSLFHAEDLPTAGAPLADTRDAAAALGEAAASLAEHHPTTGDREAFRRYAQQLREAATELHAAAHEGSRSEAVHWFEHVQASCTRCHEDFRFRAGGR